MRQRLRTCLKRLRGERGAATTELAIVGVLMIPIMMYAAYFYDALQIKLKVQEAARFAAFEWTNNPLHDYVNGHSPIWGTICNPVKITSELITG